MSSITPPKGSGPLPTTSPALGKSAARPTPESEMQRRITSANHAVEEAESEAAYRIDRIKDETDRRVTTESARQETAVENEKTKGYESLRNLQREQDAQMNRVRREGERNLATIKKHYNEAILNARTDGERGLTQTASTYGALIENERESARNQLDEVKANASQRLATLSEVEQMKIDQLRTDQRREYEQSAAKTSEAREQVQSKFQENYQAALDETQDSLSRLRESGAEKLREVRQDTAQKLAAYGERQKDPFYKMLDLQAEFHDIGEAYVVTARVPKHEQSKVSVAIRGNELVLSGYRRNEERLELGPGRHRGSASHQTYSESFPLAWPVDPKKLEKYFDGDQLYVKVEKKKEYAVTPVYDGKQQAREVSRLRAERPRLPELDELVKSPESPEAKRKGSPTLG